MQKSDFYHIRHIYNRIWCLREWWEASYLVDLLLRDRQTTWGDTPLLGSIALLSFEVEGRALIHSRSCWEQVSSSWLASIQSTAEWMAKPLWCAMALYPTGSCRLVWGQWRCGSRKSGQRQGIRWSFVQH